jgi:cytochrome b involved in lipid metabolism
MNNKNIAIIGGIALLVIIGGLVLWNMQPSNTGTTLSGTDTGSQTGSGDNNSGQSGSYAMTEVGAHNNASSCWTVIDKNVYDLTAWIPQHPGGQGAILGICGKDGTAAFHGQHDDAQRQADILATFKIGVLAR